MSDTSWKKGTMRWELCMGSDDLFIIYHLNSLKFHIKDG